MIEQYTRTAIWAACKVAAPKLMTNQQLTGIWLMVVDGVVRSLGGIFNDEDRLSCGDWTDVKWAVIEKANNALISYDQIADQIAIRKRNRQITDDIEQATWEKEVNDETRRLMEKIKSEEAKGWSSYLTHSEIFDILFSRDYKSKDVEQLEQHLERHYEYGRAGCSIMWQPETCSDELLQPLSELEKRISKIRTRAAVE